MPPADSSPTRDELQERLREALDFLGHDAREGHSSTLALLELQRIRPDPMALAELSDRLDRNARRSLAAIDDFMDLARARTQALRLEEFDLGDLLVERVADAWSLASRHGTRVQFEAGPENAPLRADRDLLSNTIGKLLRDAAARTPRGVDIRCALGATDTEWVISIDDPGAPRTLPGATGDASPWDRQRPPEERIGPGLALALVVLQRHGGHVEVDAAYQAGRTLRCHLPRA